MTTSRLARAALVYASWGWPVFPIWPRDKSPLTRNGVLDATTDAAQITRWWKHSPTANIGLACGKLVAIDHDVKPDLEIDGRETWRQLGNVTAGACVNLTPSGGQHLIWRATQPDLRNSTGKIGPGVDVRAGGGYIILPPSVHPNGGEYAWDVTAHPADAQPGPLPDAVLQILLKIERDRPRISQENPPEIPAGKRNDTIARYAGLMRRWGLTPDEMLPSLLAINAGRCHPPLDDDEVAHITASVGRYAPSRQLYETAQPEQRAEPDEPDPAKTNGGSRHYWTQQYSNRWGN